MVLENRKSTYIKIPTQKYSSEMHNTPIHDSIKIKKKIHAEIYCLKF